MKCTKSLAVVDLHRVWGFELFQGIFSGATIDNPTPQTSPLLNNGQKPWRWYTHTGTCFFGFLPWNIFRLPNRHPNGRKLQHYWKIWTRVFPLVQPYLVFVLRLFRIYISGRHHHQPYPKISSFSKRRLPLKWERYMLNMDRKNVSVWF